MADNSKFFVGVVSSSDAATYNVQVDSYGAVRAPILHGIPLSWVFASTLGFKEAVPYSVGSTVLCYAVSFDMCYILGVVPDHDIINSGFFARAALGSCDGNKDQQNIQGYGSESTKLATHNQNRPTDVVEGECVISNDLGVMVGMFQEMASLKGSELAQIQCFLLDDLVRIISHNYEHFSALGETRIFHDGKAIMAEFGATHLSGESIGIPQVEEVNSEPIFAEDSGTKPDDSQDFYKITKDERTKAIERLKIFLGRLGDFVHGFLVRPDPEAIRALNGQMGGKPDLGMMDWHISQDGRVSLRSLTAISLEKTNWIMVPHRVFSAEDPNGDNEDDISFDTKDPFEFDKTHTYFGNPTLYFLQLRDCNAYLQDFYNYKNFLKYQKDFVVNTDPSKETDVSSVSKVDPNTPVDIKDYQLRRSGIYLMENGGIMLKDAWGSAIVMEGGDIYIQPAKDLTLQPLRNLVAKVGQFTSIASKKDIDISSTDAGFRLKTKNVQHFYADKEGIIIQSNSDNTSVPSPEDQAYESFGGVMLQSKTGIYQYGDTIFDRAKSTALYKAGENTFQSESNSITLLSKQDIKLVSNGSTDVFSKSGINIVAEGSANFVGNSTNLGKEGVALGIVPHPGSMFACRYDGVINTNQFTGAIDQLASTDPQQQMQPFDTDDAFTNIKFRFLSTDAYNLQPGNTDHIPMTVAQQDDQAFSFYNLRVWQEAEVNDTLPFPGKSGFNNYFVTSELINLQKREDNDVWSKESSTLSPNRSHLVNTSLQQYKILE